MAKIATYLIYLVVFTLCYYGLNRKLSNKWIILIYPLAFAIAIIPIKYWAAYARPRYGDAFTSSWLKIILMLLACLMVFNIIYAFVNFIMNTQVNFHRKYNKPNNGFIKSFVGSSSNITSLAHLFFYIGGAILSYIVVTKY
jgi:phosphatidylglycerophosphate synthase